MNEVLRGIKLLKMYAWELSFKVSFTFISLLKKTLYFYTAFMQEKVDKIRNLELAQIKRWYNLRTINRVLFMISPGMVIFLFLFFFNFFKQILLI